MSVYEVTGTRAYRGHEPGETFEANLDHRAEARAVARGAIRVKNRSKPKVKKGSYTLPKSRG